MIELILMASLTSVLHMSNMILPVADEPTPPIAVWTAKVRPCVWPIRCGSGSKVEVASVRICVWPNRCGGGEVRNLPVLADVDVEICTVPNRCSGNSLL